ncbi:hypothetical protein Hdeb2414_s0007g00260241 [Helianthus debilis subsp. tardiflorus]
MSVPHSKDSNTPQQRSPTLYNRGFVLDRSPFCSLACSRLLQPLLLSESKMGLWILLVRPKRMLCYRKIHLQCFYFLKIRYPSSAARV